MYSFITKHLRVKLKKRFSLLPADRRDYKVIKDSFPEAYRRRFRGWRKRERQTYVEVARELTSHFNHWCALSGVESLGLGDIGAVQKYYS